jgi:Bacterial Ig domain/Lysyl oxidase
MLNSKSPLLWSCLARVANQIFTLALIVVATTPAWGSLAVDAVEFTDRSSSAATIASPTFSTTSANELLLAFVATDAKSAGITVTGVTGAHLIWALVRRTNAQLGTAEIWRAFAPSVLSNVTVTASLSQSVAASITVVTFTGADATGLNGAGAIGNSTSANASSGAPSASLVTTRNGSWVFGAGNDWDRALTHTAASGQTVLHQYLATVGDTYWVQEQNSPTLLSGTTVFINDTAPTTDRYNLTIAEVLPAATSGGTTFTISGSITPAASGAGSTVALIQNGTAIASSTADAGGNYSFGGLANGSYTITPTKTNFTFSPVSQSVTVSGANATLASFTATPVPTWSISGTISPVAAGVGTLVTLSGATSKTVTADSSGNYTFTGLANGSYTVTPSKTGFTFSPANQPVPVNGANVTGVNFTATAVPTWSISGTISPAASGSGALLTLSGTPSATTTANGSGAYSFNNLSNGTYIVTPSKTGFTFTPPNRTLTINGANLTADFTAQSGSTLLFPDLRDIIPSGNISVVQTGGNKMFQYTHDTLNGGPGPLVIQPAYNAASGSYQGMQYIYIHNASGTWSIAQTIPIAGSFIFDAAHGHFHFPFVTYGLYSVGADGNPGTPIATSGKISFCINDSFIYIPSLPNAGQIGNLGSCSDPTSLRGLNIGAVDEYDQTDEGQSISIAGVPDGTYWLRAVVDPDNYLAEADKTNNETDVEVTISGTNVMVIKQMNPVLPAPPAIVVTSPSAGTISGTVTLTASTSTTSGVQFLVDGEPLGGLVVNPTNTSSWDTTTITNGTHWLAAQTTGATGRVGTSAVVSVTVANSSAAPPVVQITSPSAGSTVNAVVTISATAASSETINSVSFFADNSLIGTVLAPPYLVSWDTQTASNGTHSLTASATDILGGVGTSPAVSVNVDNSHPPNQLAVDASASIDGNGVMTTPQFNTSNDGELLIAFVAYDGPANSPQTATISGGGLIWTLLKRSNTQAGTAEIWAARASDAPFPVTVISQPGTGTYHGSLTVIAFVNASGPGIVGQAGAASGAPDIIVPGVSAGNWVFAVGNDWDKAIGRTPVSGQVLVHQRVDTQTGDTYWVQSTGAPATANALIDIHDSSPTTDRWNYAVVEIVATPQ